MPDRWNLFCKAGMRMFSKPKKLVPNGAGFFCWAETTAMTLHFVR
ncbi:hypothetical protein QO009_001964 [Brevibacillus aydinogluensis]|jgi:hypothetical protein|uniref:Uncharacterized protein n=1 Tax=Brevibacillus aydinogluensis TaxID=927786 RepID=A0AA48RJJ8_9BACL|nr:hypothetical protein [Brevibacillus aydinogluensis]CAJ1004678.1 hypothetical protein BSPP4475_20625 [Brevibacillus aydinogluensis]